MTSDLVQRHPLKEKRRANKPLLERKRRARINDSLTDLKHLVLASLNKDVSKFAKMEKVDILDMTVQFLKGRCFENRQEDYSNVYHKGFNDGNKDILYNIMSMDNIDDLTKRKITSQLKDNSPPPSPIAYSPKPSTPTHFFNQPQVSSIFNPTVRVIEPPRILQNKTVIRSNSIQTSRLPNSIQAPRLPNLNQSFRLPSNSPVWRPW